MIIMHREMAMRPGIGINNFHRIPLSYFSILDLRRRQDLVFCQPISMESNRMLLLLLLRPLPLIIITTISILRIV